MLLRFFQLAFFLTPALLSAQKTFTVSGYIRDAKSGEVMIGAVVYVNTLHTGAATNAYGFYSLTLPKDTHSLLFSFIGYKPQLKKLTVKEDIRLNIDMEPDDVRFGEVRITAKKARENVDRPKMGIIDVPIVS